MAVSVEVKKPIRFFFFFGLFLVFILFGVKACNDRRTEQEVAEIEEILNDYDNELIPSRIAPNDKDISDSKSEPKNAKESGESDKKLSSKKNLEDSNDNELSLFSSKKPTKLKVDRSKAKAVIQVRSKKDNTTKSESTLKSADKSEKKPLSDVVTTSKDLNKFSNSNSSGGSKIRVSVDGEPYKLNAISLAKLKGAVKLYPKPDRVEIQIFSQDTQKRSSVVRQAEIKSTLIRLGLPTNTKIDFKTLDKVGFADVVFY